MATFYIDPVLGNDANAGTSTGTAWKTITNGPTAARVAPGDLIKVKKSTEYSISGTTWTFNNAAVTLPTNTTLSIEQCLGTELWVAAPNVTTSSVTTRKLGSNANQMAIAAGFTTGKVAHRAVGTPDLSPYQKICFWIRSSVAVVANNLTLRLCSDLVGNTPVHTISIPPLIANAWYPIVWDNGAALSSSIQSVSLNAAIDPGTPNIIIQNIFATNNINLACTIGPTTDTAFHPIMSIVNTTLALDISDTSNNTGGAWIDGTTGTYTTTCIEGYLAPTVNGNNTDTFQLNESGTSLPATLSGGWDFNTDTQTGYTAYIRYPAPTASYFNVVYENFILHKLNGALAPTATGLVTYRNLVFVSSTSSVLNLNDAGNLTVLNSLQFYNCTSPVIGTISGTLKTFNDCKFINISSNISSNTVIQAGFNSCTFLNCATLFNTNPTFSYIFRNCTFDSAPLPTWSNANNFIQFSFLNCTGSSMPVTTTRLVLSHQFRAYWQTATKQGSDPGAWRLDSFGTAREIGTPNLFKIGEILCTTPSAPVTVTAWIKKDNATGIGISLGVLSYELAGVTETFTTKANNTSWEQVSVTFTPTEAGVIPIYVKAWHAGTSTQVFIGSLTVS